MLGGTHLMATRFVLLRTDSEVRYYFVSEIEKQ
jgi:hypothetical protein